MGLIEFIFDAIFDAFDTMLGAMGRAVDVIVIGVDKVLASVDKIGGTLIDIISTCIDYSIDKSVHVFRMYVIYPIKFAVYWIMCKIWNYEIVVLLSRHEDHILALSKFNSSSQQCCDIGIKWLFISEKYWLLPDGTVVEDARNTSITGYITNWLPRLDKQKRLFMIFSGARPFIT